jgi:hypothetical protein
MMGIELARRRGEISMFQRTNNWRKSIKVSAAVFVILLITITVSTYQVSRSKFNADAYSLLNQKWAAMKGYIRIDYSPRTARKDLVWYYDQQDPEEAQLVNELRQVYLAAAADGAVLEMSHTAQQLGLNSAADIKARTQKLLHSNETSKPAWIWQKDPQGTPYLVRAGIIFDEARQSPFYVAIGMPVDSTNAFLWSLSRNLCAIIFCAFFSGWYLAHAKNS